MTLWVYRDRSQYLLDRVHALFRDAVVLDAVGPAALPPE
jgi:hypothetical protein